MIVWILAGIMYALLGPGFVLIARWAMRRDLNKPVWPAIVLITVNGLVTFGLLSVIMLILNSQAMHTGG